MKKKKKEIEVVLTGDISVMNIDVTYKKIQKSLHTADVVKVTGKDIENIDLSVLQLLISAKKQAEAQKKVFTVELLLPKNIESLLQRTGFGLYV